MVGGGAGVGVKGEPAWVWASGLWREGGKWTDEKDQKARERGKDEETCYSAAHTDGGEEA
jgi:hypothetical protein